MSKWIEEDVIKNSTISAEVESAFRTLITNSVGCHSVETYTETFMTTFTQRNHSHENTQ